MPKADRPPYAAYVCFVSLTNQPAHFWHSHNGWVERAADATLFDSTRAAMAVLQRHRRHLLPGSFVGLLEPSDATMLALLEGRDAVISDAR